MRLRPTNLRTQFALLASSLLAIAGLVAPAQAGALTECVGVTEVVGDYTFVHFNTVGDCAWTVPAGVDQVDFVIVGGGGGGGAGGARTASCALVGTPAAFPRFGGGGAGGAGGVVTTGQLLVTAGNQVTVTVGAGGAGGTTSPCPAGGSSSGGAPGADGQSSGFDENAAPGGGGGDAGDSFGAGGQHGGDNSFIVTYQGGTQSLAGSDCLSDSTTGCGSAPGGAGAAQDGFDPTLPDGAVSDIATNGGAGGAGALWEGNYYGGGGGGGVRHCVTPPTSAGRQGGLGGIGGGGNGSLIGCPAGSAAGSAGVDNLGGGGGGGRGNGSTAINANNAGSGGKGGDGVVIVKYLTPPANSSEIKQYTVSPNLIPSGESVTHFINGDTTTWYSFYGCWEDTVDGVGDGPIPGAPAWLGGSDQFFNDTALPQHHTRKLWLASDSNVPTDCGWVSGEPDFQTDWIVTPNEYQCANLKYLAEGASTVIGDVTVTATLNETVVHPDWPGWYWLDSYNGRDQVNFAFDKPVDGMGIGIAANDDSPDLVEHVRLDGRLDGTSVYAADYANVNAEEFVIFPQAITELRVDYEPDAGLYGSVLQLCLLAPNFVAPELSGDVQDESLTKATLNWTTTNSQYVTGYKILVDGVEVDSVDADVDSYELSGLEPGTHYNVQIVPITTQGDGDPLDLAVDTLPEPSLVVHRDEVTKTSGGLHWSTVNGGTITSYRVVVNGQTVTDLAADATSYKVRGLKANTLYVVKIFPMTADGVGQPTTIMFHTPKTVTARVTFAGDRYKLSAKALKQLQSLVDSIPVGATNVKVKIVGHVKKVGNHYSVGDHVLALARAQVVRSRLWNLGLRAKVTMRKDPWKNAAKDSFRRTDIVLTYTPPVPQL